MINFRDYYLREDDEPESKGQYARVLEDGLRDRGYQIELLNKLPPYSQPIRVDVIELSEMINRIYFIRTVQKLRVGGVIVF